MSEKSSRSRETITDTAIHKLGYAAGIKRMSDLSLTIRNAAKKCVKNIMRKAVIYSNQVNKKTITEAMMSAALPYSAYSSELKGSRCETRPVKSPKKVRAKPGTKALKEIRWYQSKYSCFNIPKASFDRYARDMAKEFAKDLRFSVKAMLLIHYIVEDYLIDILREANAIAINSERVTVKPKDVNLALRIREETL